MKRMILCLLALFLVAGFGTATAQTLKMVYFDNFAPFSWKDESGAMRGILIDVVDEVAGKQMGIPLSHEGFPWARAQDRVRGGQADAFITVPTPERRGYTEISEETVISSRMTLFTRNGHENIDALKQIQSIPDLKGFILLDYIGNGWAERNLKDYDRQLSPRPENVFQMLAAGRGDLFITDSVVGGFTILNMGLRDQIIEIPNILDEVPFSLCIGKKSPFTKILPEFDKKLSQLRESGKLEEIYNQYR
ncbi:polar amino acid transport system substrate-binding protein [Desulfobotulus alkaliphilus]|uniref:Polar amino acid transport system substrate-binding protein n=1 Tax=Desulfobotulus alkaliphilus TaxID=622671 RepID=A0A562R9P1_9BACT|nr:transporter substrate-binding domain-containing protein [Desulfobotulus alkaliphilus]TWI65778.1 polar amino acid transport system substrate-binding protein [Desulfobotulus alkaliphilus]